ncbi:MAG: hypothetical protein H7287_12420, partial [Thermoleophilia bacterium]|nr:hypothetical protein [Thermoleophilia bacterium]
MSVTTLLLLVLVAVVVPQLFGGLPQGMVLNQEHLGSSWQHPLGTDFGGRDITAQTAGYLRRSLAVGFVGAGVWGALLLPVGLFAGWARRRLPRRWVVTMLGVAVQVVLSLVLLGLAWVEYVNPTTGLLQRDEVLSVSSYFLRFGSVLVATDLTFQLFVIAGLALAIALSNRIARGGSPFAWNLVAPAITSFLVLAYLATQFESMMAFVGISDRQSLGGVLSGLANARHRGAPLSVTIPLLATLTSAAFVGTAWGWRDTGGAGAPTPGATTGRERWSMRIVETCGILLTAVLGLYPAIA